MAGEVVLVARAVDMAAATKVDKAARVAEAVGTVVGRVVARGLLVPLLVLERSSVGVCRMRVHTSRAPAHPCDALFFFGVTLGLGLWSSTVLSHELYSTTTRTVVICSHSALTVCMDPPVDRATELRFVL